MLKASHVRTKRAAFTEASMSSTPASARLVADDADCVPAEPREAAHDVLGPVRLHLEELAVVEHPLDHLLHVVRLVRAVGDDLSSDESSRSAGSDGGAYGAASRLF